MIYLNCIVYKGDPKLFLMCHISSASMLMWINKRHMQVFLNFHCYLS
jgi:hypothetical protein